MASYSTPGVYVEEISTLPPSVAQVATAVPAFIGFTEKGEANKPVRISGMLEFQTIFGSFYPAQYTVDVETGDKPEIKNIRAINRTSDEGFYLYYGLRNFFDNGGGSCYVVSVGTFADREGKTEEIFTGALDEVKKLDEPTLLVFPDALFLSSGKYYSVVSAALAQCAALQDRFTIIDVHPNVTDSDVLKIGTSGELKTGAALRAAGLPTENLKYGAAYTPFLNTTYSYGFNDSGITIKEPAANGNRSGGTILDIDKAAGATLEVLYTSAKPADAAAPAPQVEIIETTAAPKITVTQPNKLTITVQRTDADAAKGTTIAQLKTAWQNVKTADRKNFDLKFTGDDQTKVKPIAAVTLDYPGTLQGALLGDSLVKEKNSALYNQIKAKLADDLVMLPPSAAMAGVYARVDRNRGVWKAPANVSLASVIGPTIAVTNEEQGDLNIDPTSGKSINCIRSFTGKGTLVWGARTLAGNDNEWRYINVRRLFINIEESVNKASAFAVFEPNDASTWLKVKAMIDNYLYGLWQQGALAGPTPEASYFVNIGLGKTMTNEDILNGYMIVEVGIAAVRPAEFVVLRFSHKLQEA